MRQNTRHISYYFTISIMCPSLTVRYLVQYNSLCKFSQNLKKVKKCKVDIPVCSIFWIGFLQRTFVTWEHFKILSPKEDYICQTFVSRTLYTRCSLNCATDKVCRIKKFLKILHLSLQIKGLRTNSRKAFQPKLMIWVQSEVLAEHKVWNSDLEWELDPGWSTKLRIKW